MSEAIKTFARSILTELARLSALRLANELSDLKIDSSQFTIATLIVPNACIAELEAATIAIQEGASTRIVSGEVLTRGTGVWAFDDYEELKNSLLIIQDAVDTAVGNLQVTLAEMKTRREKETH